MNHSCLSRKKRSTVAVEMTDQLLKDARKTLLLSIATNIAFVADGLEDADELDDLITAKALDNGFTYQEVANAAYWVFQQSENGEIQ